MFYIDSQRTVTRRDSSLISSYTYERNRDDLNSVREHLTSRHMSESVFSAGNRPTGSVRKELITSLFESMLDSIVISWDVIERKTEEFTLDFGKIPSDVTVKKKKSNVNKQPKVKKSRSIVELSDSKSDVIQTCWWSSPDERAIIKFRNGCTYEGNISMKCMHGEGRYQWADGTVYLGQFKNNEITGKGTIYWKDDTWYQGDFYGNLRHGNGLYVDSRRQRSYAGKWHYGTKDGQGVIYYDGSFKNSYDGEWALNERHGYGSREYCKVSGYKGEWNKFIREGKGMMIWPNHDFYRGEWKNGVMSGYGFYIWEAYYNNSMSLPSLCAYRGFWEKGKRNGYGILNLGLALGSYYKGEFKNNKKHGVGKFVTNNGQILQHKKLFIDDNMGSLNRDDDESDGDDKCGRLEEPYLFDICNDSVGLLYHVERVIKNIDRKQETINRIVYDFIELNKIHSVSRGPKDDIIDELNGDSFADLIDFEISSLYKSLRCYETDLKNIYYKYATICNTEEINFKPILIRLYLWQLYYDCNLHDKGLTLVDIDRLFHENPEWLSRKPHNPFEKIYFWQFQHSLISVASKLYAKRHLPGKKPDTMLASAFRLFMEKDILPGAGRKRGRLVGGCGSFVPLKDLYHLYQTLDEPCTVRTFLCAARHAPHYAEQPSLVDYDCSSLGRNAYIFGDEISFIMEDPTEIPETNEKPTLKLFNIGNLSSKAIIKIFSFIFPQISELNKIMNLDVEITFFEFFQALIMCVEESLRLSEQEVYRNTSALY
ncbi:radial spoke head 10 homolog B-like isoform X1 [Danaus plexippus]|uniref:radial spoke head 10 homolog B-like isoform X1 n=1 Tax=Danaus plexippus TaxID=13037 RepID=UPI002AB28A1B|nr:radial spoke head 10 homolog B-like isoform X1 [Danaus plexippus]